MRRIVFAFAVFAVACGGGGGSNGGVTAPTPTIPSVSGNYSGNATFTFPELQLTLTCPATTTINQSGRTINAAPLVLRGDCDLLSIPLGQTTIDETGAIESGSATGSYNEPSCGVYNFTISGGFFGRELRISMVATSATCYNFNFTATLSR